MLQAGGSFIVLLETKGVAKSALKAEWGPPLRLYDIRGVADGNRPALVAQFESDKGWAIQQRVLEYLVSSLTVEREHWPQSCSPPLLGPLARSGHLASPPISHPTLGREKKKKRTIILLLIIE